MYRLACDNSFVLIILRCRPLRSYGRRTLRLSLSCFCNGPGPCNHTVQCYWHILEPVLVVNNAPNAMVHLFRYLLNPALELFVLVTSFSIFLFAITLPDRFSFCINPLFRICSVVELTDGFRQPFHRRSKLFGKTL